MPSPSKGEWKNPRDVMKIHRIKRQSSSSNGVVQLRSSGSNGITRRHSFTVMSQNAEGIGGANSSPNFSKSDAAIHSGIMRLQQKRRNPFVCDIPMSSQNTSKRRSVLDFEKETDSPNFNADDNISPSDTTSCQKLIINAVEDNEGHEIRVHGIKQRSLLQALNFAEKMEIQNPSVHCVNPDESVIEEVTGPLAVQKVCSVLKEKDITSNTIDTDIGMVMPTQEQGAKVFPHPPLDWSLKSKLRVVLHSNVHSFQKYPGIDAKHVDNFVHHRFDTPEWADLDILQKIRRCCMHYSYPQLSWLSAFPRLSTDYKRCANVLSSHDDVLEALSKDWCSTLTMVYQQLRSGLCPYFYVCTHQFSVLFRCLRSSSKTSWSALLSPSTRGLREMLIKEGIEYRLPNVRACRTNTAIKDRKIKGSPDINDENEPPLDQSQLNKHSKCQEETEFSRNESTEKGSTWKDADYSKTGDKTEDDDDDDDIGDDDDASLWLEGIGLNKKDFPSVEPFKVKLQREGYQEIDNRPQSMVFVEGADVHPFFNFLLNYSSCIASSGPQHGIPPTILSPVSFVGGTLVQNSVKHTTIIDGHADKQLERGNSSTHVFEIAGPILPHHSLNIASVLHGSTECRSASMVYNTHAPSAAFNTQTQYLEEKEKLASGLSKLIVNFSQANPGLVQDVKDHLSAPLILETGKYVRELSISHSGYSWLS